MDIDKVWAGARVDFAAAADRTNYVIGYYDQERWLTIAMVNAVSRDIRKQQLQSRFGGWDSHNSVALAIDRNRLLHVAANMHADKLNYFRTLGPDQPLARSKMTSHDEDEVTYPQFLKSADGDLLFIYRSGKSGEGAWKVNHWDGQRWTSVGREPFLGDRGFGRNVSAYPSRFAVAHDGYIHLAIVWRLTSDASTNVRISYAKTKDFANWFGSRNQQLKVPLTPETTETVLHTGTNAGLLNNAKISIDPKGRPVIAFTRQNAQGRNTVELMIGENHKWRSLPIATADRSFPVKGTGSLPNTVAVSEVDFTHETRPTLYYRFPDKAAVHEALDPATLAPACIEKPAADPFGKFAERPIPTMQTQIRRIDNQATLVWAAQPANKDRQPPCTPAAPLACTPPPSTLKLITTEPAKAP
jgi:hypothetical protein